MARKRSLWTEWQREVARRQRVEQQQRLAAEREVKRQIQAEQQAARATARQTALDEKERKRPFQPGAVNNGKLIRVVLTTPPSPLGPAGELAPVSQGEWVFRP